MSFVVRRHHQAATCFLIQPMHDPRPLFSANSGEIPAMVKKRIDERMLLMAGSGMDDESGRLVDDEQVLVFEKNAQRNVFRGQIDFLRRWLIQFDPVSRPNSLTWARRLPIQPNEPIADQLLEPGARVLRERAGQEKVQTLPGFLGRHDEGDRKRD